MSSQNGENKPHPIDIRNAQAVAANLAAFQTQVEGRLQFLENEVATMKNLLNGVMQTVAVALHEVRGTGATVEDDGDHD